MMKAVNIKGTRIAIDCIRTYSSKPLYGNNRLITITFKQSEDYIDFPLSNKDTIDLFKSLDCALSVNVLAIGEEPINEIP